MASPDRRTPESPLPIERDGAVETLAINDAPRNRMTLAFMDEIEAEIERVANDTSVRAIVIRGAGADSFSVLELRGGTHLVLLRSDEPRSGAAPFDLMVEDLEANHERLTGLGLAPSPIVSGRIHRSFSARDPSGQEVEFNSSHVSSRPV